MKLYNTLTRNLDELEPLSPPAVSLYTCGLTVYDYPHIGNWFAYLRWDLLVRALKANNYDVNWVMNITDVGHLVSDADDGEDKLEKGARREGKTAWDVARFYEDYFVGGMKRLNILLPDQMPRATDHIAEQIALIQTLEEKGFTYIIDDGVYYDTSKFPGYASFAKLDLEEQQAGARVQFNTQKRNPTDFALWKFSPKDETRDMEWDSPWSDTDEPRKGFPGWHIECSAMSMKYLGETLDIHTGGIDHVPVHHTNEIAQSEAATGKRFCNMWLHSNHITVNGEKISKSLGNGIRLEDLEERGTSLVALRLHAIESHYRSQSKFSWESLEAAANRLQHWYGVAALAWQPVNGAIDHVSYQKTLDLIQHAPGVLTSIVANDLDTPQALAYIDEVFSSIEATLLAPDAVHAFRSLLRSIDDILGLDLSLLTDITDEQKATTKARETARLSKDWAASDQLRDQLADAQIGVRDTPYGTIWFPL
jgi:cysteinyl-tRNA synthetase